MLFIAVGQRVRIVMNNRYGYNKSKLCKYLEDAARGRYSTTGKFNIYTKFKEFSIDFKYCRYSKMVSYQVWLQRAWCSKCLCAFWIKEAVFYE